jgi:hypothetical protein
MRGRGPRPVKGVGSAYIWPPFAIPPKDYETGRWARSHPRVVLALRDRCYRDGNLSHGTRKEVTLCPPWPFSRGLAPAGECQLPKPAQMGLPLQQRALCLRICRDGMTTPAP